MHKALTIADINQVNKKSPPEKLTKINFPKYNLEDISILKQFPNLEEINLNDNWIKTLSPFANLVHLKELYLKNNEIDSFKEVNHLKKLRCLKVLFLKDNPIQFNLNYRKEIFVILPQLEHLDENKTVYVSKHNIIRSSCSSNEISHYETIKVSNVVQSVALLLNDLSLEQNEELKMYVEKRINKLTNK
jgi:hypothetical protein